MQVSDGLPAQRIDWGGRFLTLGALGELAAAGEAVGFGAGCLESELDARSASFLDCNDRIDEALAAMDAAWTGESMVRYGDGCPVDEYWVVAAFVEPTAVGVGWVCVDVRGGARGKQLAAIDRLGAAVPAAVSGN